MSMKDELKAITKRYADDYMTICERSREERIKSLQPGAPLPAKDILYGDDAKQSFKEKADACRTEAAAIIGKELLKLHEQMTAAPSSEAVNSLQLLKMRDNVTAEEISGLMQRYGSNSMVYDTLRDLAAQHGIKEYAFESNPVRVKAEKLSDLKANLDKNLRVDRAERGYASAGFIAFLDAAIDDALPDEA